MKGVGGPSSTKFYEAWTHFVKALRRAEIGRDEPRLAEEPRGAERTPPRESRRISPDLAESRRISPNLAPQASRSYPGTVTHVAQKEPKPVAIYALHMAAAEAQDPQRHPLQTVRS